MTEIPSGLELLDKTKTPLPEGLTQHTAVPSGLTVVNQPPQSDTPMPDATPVMDEAVNKSSVGRVLDAFGQGLDAGWGAEPVGLSADSEAALRGLGVFKDVNDTTALSLKAFNQALIRPLAAGVDALFRAGNAGVYGIALSTGVAFDEVGLSEATGLPGRRLTRDIVQLADTIGVVTGTHGSMPRKPRQVKSPEAITRTDRATINSMTNVTDAKTPASPTQSFPDHSTPVVDKAGNINLNRIASGDDVKDVIRETSAVAEDFVGARRGKMSLEETEDLANAMGMTPEALTKRKVGEAFNAEEAVAARNLLVQSAESIKDLAIKAAGGTDGDILNFQEAMTRHMAIQEQVSGITAEAGRALSAFRITAAANKEAKAISEFLDSMGGRTPIEDIARKLSDFDSPQQISKFMQEARKATTSDMVVEAWINGLLSGPQTHVTNIVSNTITSLLAAPLERGVAAAISTVKGQKGMDKVRFGEVGQKLFGFVQGAQDGVRAGARAFKTEMPTNRAEKLEVAKHKAIPSKKFTIGGREIEVGGKQLRLPGRALTAADEFFKAIGYRQELNALAYRKAATEGLRGQAFKERIAELVENPTKQIREAATGTAEYQTFTKPLGEMGQGVQKFANAHPAMKIPLTFIRTPVNIIKYAGERSPLAILSKEVRASLRGAEGGAVASEQWARMVTGSAVATAAGAVAMQDGLTGGGPKDPKERALWYLAGNQPYSIRIGEVNYSYARLEPFGVLFGVTADMYAASENLSDPDMADIASLLTGSIAKNIVSKTWLKGPSDMIEAFNDPDRYGANYIRKLLGSVVPTGAAQIARVDDPYLREARTILDTLKSRLPGLSADLLPRRDVWGEPIKLEGSLGPDILSPVYLSKVNNDPVTQELLSIGVFPSKLKRTIRGIELTDAQYDDYQMTAGRLTKTTLDAVVATPGWTTIPEFNRVDVVTRTINQTRDRARTAMLMKYPSIMQDYMTKRQAQMQGK